MNRSFRLATLLWPFALLALVAAFVSPSAAPAATRREHHHTTLAFASRQPNAMLPQPFALSRR